MPLVQSLALVMAVSSGAVSAGGPASPVHIDVGVIVKSHVPVAPLFIVETIQEAADVWAPYGVSVAEIGAGTCPAAPYDVVLSVNLSDRPISGAATVAMWETHLAAIRFTREGLPSTRIDMYYAGAVRLAAMLGPRDRFMGRIAGRALAHEIGHYLLRTPRHAPEGLMLGVHRALELAGVDRTAFALSDGDLNRFRAVWFEPHAAGIDLAR